MKVAKSARKAKMDVDVVSVTPPSVLQDSVAATQKVVLPQNFVDSIKKRLTSEDPAPGVKVLLTVSSDVSRKINVVAASLGVNRYSLYIAILEAFTIGKGVDFAGDLRDFS